MVDTALSSLNERFQNIAEVNGKFGVLLNFPNMTKVEQLQYCENLSAALTHDGQPDIDGEFSTFPFQKDAKHGPLDLPA